MAHQWGRLIWWLAQRQNAAAVQAIVACVGVPVAILVLVATMRYVVATNRLLKVADRQMRAAVLPQVSVELVYAGSKTGTITIRNLGASYLRFYDLIVARTYRHRKVKSWKYEQQISEHEISPFFPYGLPVGETVVVEYDFQWSPPHDFIDMTQTVKLTLTDIFQLVAYHYEANDVNGLMFTGETEIRKKRYMDIPYFPPRSDWFELVVLLLLFPISIPFSLWKSHLTMKSRRERRSRIPDGNSKANTST
jgi:hypothetical protein